MRPLRGHRGRVRPGHARAAPAVRRKGKGRPRRLREVSLRPATARVAQIKLDSILCVVAAAPLPHAGVDAFLVFVSPAQATILWRSFLSFQEVSPAGTVILDQLVRQGLPWGEDASSLGRVEPSQETLSGWGLLRPGSDFIGARALSGQR